MCYRKKIFKKTYRLTGCENKERRKERKKERIMKKRFQNPPEPDGDLKSTKGWQMNFLTVKT
jgi:hypothetical protein